MIERVIRIRWFLGSTLERIQEEMDKFTVAMCPGNFVDMRLWKHGGVYQAALIYAEVVPAEVNNV